MTSWALARAAVICACIIGNSHSANADDDPNTPVDALEPRRYELAGFPVVGGSTDIGVLFGGVATLTRFYDDVKPYLWNIDLLLSASLKSEQHELRLVQQSHLLRLDAPDLLSGRLRIDVFGSFQRTIIAGYYGLGNATTAGPAPGTAEIGRRYHYLYQEGRARAIARVHTGTPFDLALGGNVRYVAPEAYASSKLAEDGAARNADGSPVLRGLETAALLGGGAGIMVDTRDTEFVTTRGIFYQVGLGATVGSGDARSYGNTSAVLSHYAPLGGPFVFANRVVASFEFGNVPFYDLAQGGTFEPQYLLGSESGVRGVPQGRYAGLVKVITNTELRTVLKRFRLFGQRLRPGTTVFADAGRVWSGYGIDPARDGTKLRLKYGLGGGVFVQWGEAAIFRLEVAYSPDAVAENPGFPVGVYVSDGLMF
jgi:hypothetical protein